MMVNANTKQIEIQSCNEKKRNAIEFSKPGVKPTYSISIKVPAIVIAVRKLLPNIPEGEAITFNGRVFADEKTIIYDLNEDKPAKKRGRKRKSEPEDGEVDGFTVEQMAKKLHITNKSVESYLFEQSVR